MWSAEVSALLFWNPLACTDSPIFNLGVAKHRTYGWKRCDSLASFSFLNQWYTAKIQTKGRSVPKVQWLLGTEQTPAFELPAIGTNFGAIHGYWAMRGSDFHRGNWPFPSLACLGLLKGHNLEDFIVWEYIISFLSVWTQEEMWGFQKAKWQLASGESSHTSRAMQLCFAGGCIVMDRLHRRR